MSNMFERFTDRARRIMVLAQDEARLLNHNYLGTEHLLLGLIAEGEGTAARALTKLGLTTEKLRDQVEDIIGSGNTLTVGPPPFTPRGKRVVELAFREALQLGHNYISTEHLLLGIIREGEGVGVQALQKLQVDLVEVRQAVLDELRSYARAEQEISLEPQGVVVDGNLMDIARHLHAVADLLTKRAERR